MIRVVAAVIEEALSEPIEGGGASGSEPARERPERQPRILICKRAPGGAFAGKWEFPGGKIKSGETPEAALQRELREELEVQTSIGKFIQQVHHQYAEMTQEVELTFFYAGVRSGTPRNVCFEEICWVHRDELPSYDFLEADRFLVTQLSLGLW